MFAVDHAATAPLMKPSIAPDLPIVSCAADVPLARERRRCEPDPERCAKELRGRELGQRTGREKDGDHGASRRNSEHDGNGAKNPFAMTRDVAPPDVPPCDQNSNPSCCSRAFTPTN